MNEIILSILKIYITTSVIYFIYIVYCKITKKETLDDIINEYNNKELEDKYKSIKKTKSIVIILGILLGIVVLVFTQSSNEINIKNSNTVYDISDINVI